MGTHIGTIWVLQTGSMWVPDGTPCFLCVVPYMSGAAITQLLQSIEYRRDVPQNRDLANKTQIITKRPIIK